MKFLIVLMSPDMYSNTLSSIKTIKLETIEYGVDLMQSYKKAWKEQQWASLTVLLQEILDSGELVSHIQESFHHPLKEKIVINRTITSKNSSMSVSCPSYHNLSPFALMGQHQW